MKPVVKVVRTREALEAIVPAWEELAAHACEANPFYEHWILLPALRAVYGEKAGDGNFHCVCAWQPPTSSRWRTTRNGSSSPATTRK